MNELNVRTADGMYEVITASGARYTLVSTLEPTGLISVSGGSKELMETPCRLMKGAKVGSPMLFSIHDPARVPELTSPLLETSKVRSIRRLD